MTQWVVLVGGESSDECGYFVLAVTAAGVIERDPSCEREKESREATGICTRSKGVVCLAR
jgi:hypothetical protein